MNIFQKPQPKQIPLDPRWRIWAEAVVKENTTLAGRKWAGKNKLFRRAEYETGLKRLTVMGFLHFRGERQGYRPWRGRGWQYIINMSRGLVTIPPPLLETTSPRPGAAVKRAGQKMHRVGAEKSTEEEQG